MTIATQIEAIQAALKFALPQFYVDFLTANDLENDNLFNDLTLIYGASSLLDMQTLAQEYLPNYLKIGDDSGDYGIFILLNQANNQLENTAIYITEMGDLDETSLEKLADNFASWANKDFDTAIFLENFYTKQDAFRRSQINAPLFNLKQQISELNKQLNALNHQKSNGEVDLKGYLLQKKAIGENKEKLAIALAVQEAALLEINTRAASRALPTITTRIIENELQIKLPLLYKKLAADGMLEYADAFGSDWYAKVYPTLKNQPPFLLFAKNVELMRLRDVYDETREMMDDRNADWLDDFNFVPFAGDGSGDKYGFYWQADKPEPQIIYWWHDSDHCDIKANNLQDFVFIKMLDCALECEPDYDLVTEGDIQTNLNNMLATHEKYLTNAQVAVLKDIYNRPMIEDKGVMSALSLQEYQHILQQQIGYFGDLGKFSYINKV